MHRAPVVATDAPRPSPRLPAGEARLGRLDLPQQRALQRAHDQPVAAHLLDRRLHAHAQHGRAHLRGPAGRPRRGSVPAAAGPLPLRTRLRPEPATGAQEGGIRTQRPGPRRACALHAPRARRAGTCARRPPPRAAAPSRGWPPAPQPAGSPAPARILCPSSTPGAADPTELHPPQPSPWVSCKVVKSMVKRWTGTLSRRASAAPRALPKHVSHLPFRCRLRPGNRVSASYTVHTSHESSNVRRLLPLPPSAVLARSC